MAGLMVLTCPHALGLAVPLVVAISISVSARKGLLIRNRTAFENSRKIKLKYLPSGFSRRIQDVIINPLSTLGSVIA
jgi:hypothetical protein